MANLGQLSFRRILLSRFLLLSVPVLLMGVYITYRKARSATLETARQNLTESAIIQSQRLNQSITALRANLVTASETVTLKSVTPENAQVIIQQLATHLSTTLPNIQCLQIIGINTNEVLGSTCDSQPLGDLKSIPWRRQKGQGLIELSQVKITPGIPNLAVNDLKTNQLPLVFNAPVYNLEQRLSYILQVQTAILQQQPIRHPRTGYPVVMDQEGLILAHTDPDAIGRNLRETEEQKRANSLLSNALSDEPGFIHLYGLETRGLQFLAGYTNIPNPLNNRENERWVILTATPIENIFTDLKKIQQILLILTCTLIIVSVMAVLFIGRELALPLEKLRDYALNQDHAHSTAQVPQNLKIREFNQLAIALNGMVKRLKTWAEELEFAWKEAQTANQLKSEFLATTSHELRTPLNGIIGSIRLIRDGYCDNREEELEFLERADSSAVHLLGIINDVLDIAKIEAGKLAVSIEKVNLNSLLNEVIDLHTLAIQEKGLQLHPPANDPEIMVYADPSKLKQVFINVIGNAIKFTDAGSIIIDYRLEIPLQEQSPQSKQAIESVLDSPMKKQVIISITDTGIGIESKQQEKLFHPFVMSDGSTTRKFEGAGLGLAISKNLIEMMEGTICLSSPGKDQGTTVEICLPVISITTTSKEINGKN